MNYHNYYCCHYHSDSVGCVSLLDMLATVNLGQATQKTNSVPYGGSDDDHEPEAVNKKAISIVNRVRDKLTGQLVSVWVVTYIVLFMGGNIHSSLSVWVVTYKVLSLCGW